MANTSSEYKESKAVIEESETEKMLYVKLDKSVSEDYTHAAIKKGNITYQLGKKVGNNIQLDDFVRRADFEVNKGTSVNTAFEEAVTRDLLINEGLSSEPVDGI